MILIQGIILTLNEELHIARCIESIAPICSDILVLDSGSTDRTRAIASGLGARVIENKFLNHAAQLNAAISLCADFDGWLLRIDADEILDATAVQKFLRADHPQATTNGMMVRRRLHFMGRPMKWGGMDPVWTLRLWRNRHGQCEQRWMDEHVRVTGEIKASTLIIDDINMNSLHWWTQKHNDYASREAIEILLHRSNSKLVDKDSRLQSQAARKRWIKNNIYTRMPATARGCLYFLYRYLIRLGFLDGRQGFYFHFLQAFWYRTLVEAKCADIESYIQTHDASLVDAIRLRTGIDVSTSIR